MLFEKKHCSKCSESFCLEKEVSYIDLISKSIALSTLYFLHWVWLHADCVQVGRNSSCKLSRLHYNAQILLLSAATLLGWYPGEHQRSIIFPTLCLTSVVLVGFVEYRHSQQWDFCLSSEALGVSVCQLCKRVLAHVMAQGARRKKQVIWPRNLKSLGDRLQIIQKATCRCQSTSWSL